MAPKHIRPARLDDIEAMREIERAAGRLFAGIGMDDVAADPPLERAVLAGYIENGRAWIAEIDGQPAGYAIADIVDGCGHLEQVSVRPEYGRQGLGRGLIQTVAGWARAQGSPALTLLTFREVPWNGPYYASLGFRPLADADLSPGLLALRAHESTLGLDREARFAMRLDLQSAGASITGDLPIVAFPSRQAWGAWLAAHHEASAGVWLKIARKGSGIDTVSYGEALEVALCYGWIDGQKARFDDAHWLQRFTPRRPGSKWSKVNRDKATELMRQGAMKPAGLREVERAKADGRWNAAYESQSTATVPDDFQQALDANPVAREFFATLDSANRYAILYRIQDAKRPETRARRIAQYVTMLNEGKKLHPCALAGWGQTAVVPISPLRDTSEMRSSSESASVPGGRQGKTM